MTEYIGDIAIPEIAASGVFPLVPDFGYGYAQAPGVAIHQFGSANAKIEQRFYLGTSAKRFTVRRAYLTEADRIALRDFWEDCYGPYGAFTYNAPNDNGVGTTAYTVRFANEPLSWEMLSDYISSVGITLIELPTTSPTYTVNSTVNRFPSSGLQTALLSQTQEIIPLIKIQPRETGYDAIYVSDRRCTVGGQLYQPRLLEFDGISQSIGGESDQAQFTFGNADRVMRELVNDTNLTRAALEFSLFHVGTGIKLDLWKGEIVSWEMDSGPEFKITAADGIYELTLPYPCRRISRTCWKCYDDGNGCPYTAESTGLDTTHFPTVSAGSCDKGYDTANGCLAHGMKHYFGGILARPQGGKATSPFYLGMTTSMAVKSLSADSMYDAVMAEIYCYNPSYVDENGDTKYGLPVPCLIATGRDEDVYYQALGIVGEGPLIFGNGHTLDGMYHYGHLTGTENNGLTKITGQDPAGTNDYFSLMLVGNQVGGDFRKVLYGGNTYDDNFAAGTAALIIKRKDDKGIQLTRLTEHNMEAIISCGLMGWVWTDASTRGWSVLTNPVWIVINMLLKALGVRYASATTQKLYFDIDAALAAAAICDQSVTKLIGSGSELQFMFQGILRDEKPLRDWMQDVLMNCLGYYTWVNSKLKIGIRENSSAVEAFTEGNILFNSLRLAPSKPAFNYLTAYFSDAEYKFASNNVAVYDVDNAKLIGGATTPVFNKAQIQLAGTCTKSQAARIISTRLREELGGISETQWMAAREISIGTTVLALNVEPGMVCSLTHDDMPAGVLDGDPVPNYGEFRVTGWKLNKDYSIEIQGKTTVDEMYDLTTGPKPADVVAYPVPVEVEVVESAFLGLIEKVATMPAYGTQGRVVFLTADDGSYKANTLYRDTGTGWTAVVSTTDLNGNISQTNLNVANRGWSQTCAFTITDADTVAWGAGTFTSADGTAYSIGAGNTGNMTAKSFIYLDTAVSTTAYQVTTTPANAIGAGKVLIAVAQNGAVEPTFQVMQGQGGKNIDASEIVAGSITANEIAASTITTDKLSASYIEVGDAAADVNAGVTTIDGGQITADSIAVGTLTANSIVAANITSENVEYSHMADGAVSVDLGDPSGADFDITPADNNWHTMDLSSILPAGYRNAVLRVVQQASYVGSSLEFRKNGATYFNNIDVFYSPQTTAIHHTVICRMDADRKVEWCWPGGLSGAHFYVTVAMGLP